MPHKPHESMANWYERAIVTDSLAAEDLEAMDRNTVVYNAPARSSIHHTAAVARADLQAAREAYTRVHRPADPIIDAARSGQRISPGQ